MTDQSNAYKSSIIEGEQYFQSGDYEKALELFESVLQEAPDNIEALNDAGVVYSQLGQTDRAIESFERLLELQPSNEDGFYNLVDNYTNNDDLQSVQRVFNAYSKHIPDSELKQKYAELLGMNGDGKNENPLQIQIASAEQLFQNGDVDGAKQSFEALDEEHPGTSEILNDLGVLAATEENYQQAISYLTDAFFTSGGDTDSRQNLLDLVQVDACKTILTSSLEKYTAAPSQGEEERKFYRFLTKILQAKTPYRAAVRNLNITPEVSEEKPLLLQGYATGPRQAVQALSPLSMQLLMLEDEHFNKLFIITADLFGFDEAMVQKIRELLEPWGIPAESIILNASHTHYAPGTVNGLPELLGTYYEKYASLIVQAIAQELESLYEDLQSCYIYAGSTEAQNGVNRRLPQNGAIEFGPNPEGFYPGKTPVIVVSLVNEEKDVVLVNHGCHPTGLGAANVIFADYPIYVREFLKKRPDITEVMFLQGAAGDIKEANLNTQDVRFTQKPEEVAQNGKLLAERVASMMEDSLQQVSGTFTTGIETTNIPYQDIDISEEIAQIRESGNGPLLQSQWADAIETMNGAATDEKFSMEVQSISLGDSVYLLTVPGEPVGELAEPILSTTDFPGTKFLLGYTNGLNAYLPSARQVEEGGYEADSAKYVYNHPAPFDPTIEENLIQTIKDLHKRTISERADAPQFSKLLEQSPAFFTLSSGRCGTKTLSHILNTATNAQVYHHPRPYLINQTLQAYHNTLDKLDTFWSARRSVINAAWHKGQIFGELDHNMTPFAPVIAEEIPQSKFIVLVRNPWDFVRSGMRRDYYNGHPWDSGRLRPESSHPDFERWESMSQFEKVCWLWNETYARIQDYLQDIPEERYKIVKFEELVKGPEVTQEIFEFLGLEGFDVSQVQSILDTPMNKQTVGDFPKPGRWDPQQHKHLWNECRDTIMKFGYGEYEEQYPEPDAHVFSSTNVKNETDRLSLLFLEQEGLSTGGHLDHVVPALQDEFAVNYLKTDNLQEAKNAIEAADIIWLEWASQLTAAVTQKIPQLREKPVLCRLHGFEVFTDMPSQIDWNVVDNLIFVADHKREIFNGRFPEANVHQTVIRNGVNMDGFSVPENKENTKNLLLLGHINYRKGLTLLMQYYHELLKRDPEFHLYIRGDWQDLRYKMAVMTMVHELGLEDDITFVQEWIDDLDSWLIDKSHILSFSLEESFHYAIGNGMAAGMKPVIHAWNESRDIWPEEFIFRNLDEFLSLMLEDSYTPERYRELLFSNNLHANYQIESFRAEVERLTEGRKKSPPKRRTSRKTNAIRQWYDKKYGENKSGAYRNKYSYKPVVDLLHLTKKDVLLDVGSGQGFVLDWASKVSRNAYGVAISKNALLESKKNSPTSSVSLGMGEYLPFQSEKFTAIICNGVLEHFQSIETGLTEFHRVLKPGGRVLINVPNIDFKYWSNDNKGTSQQEIQEALYSLNEWRELVKGAGFEIVDIKTDNFIAPLPQRLNKEESYQLVFLCSKGEVNKKWGKSLQDFDEAEYTHIVNDRLKNGDAASAYAFLKQVISLYPTKAGLFRTMGVLCLQVGRSEESDGYFTDFYGASDRVNFVYENRKIEMRVTPGDHIARVLQTGNFYEKDLLEFTIRRYGKGMNIIDIGGHIGNHTVFWGRVGNAQQIDVFEPNEKTRKLLQENIKLNDLGNVRIHPYAIGRSRGKATLAVVNEQNTGSTKVCTDEAGDVEVRALSEVINTKADIIKIDVEGMAGDVLVGARDIITTQHPALIIECGDEKEYDEVTKVLGPIGYVPVRRFNYTPTIIFEYDSNANSPLPKYSTAIALNHKSN